MNQQTKGKEKQRKLNIVLRQLLPRNETIKHCTLKEWLKTKTKDPELLKTYNKLRTEYSNDSYVSIIYERSKREYEFIGKKISKLIESNKQDRLMYISTLPMLHLFIPTSIQHVQLHTKESDKFLEELKMLSAYRKTNFQVSRHRNVADMDEEFIYYFVHSESSATRKITDTLYITMRKLVNSKNYYLIYVPRCSGLTTAIKQLKKQDFFTVIDGSTIFPKSEIPFIGIEKAGITAIEVMKKYSTSKIPVFIFHSLAGSFSELSNYSITIPEVEYTKMKTYRKEKKGKEYYKDYKTYKRTIPRLPIQVILVAITKDSILQLAKKIIKGF